MFEGLNDMQELNRKIVIDYFNETFERKRPDIAASQFLSPSYRHHGEGSGSGREDFVQYFTNYFNDHPDFLAVTLKCLSDEHMVALHVRTQSASGHTAKEVAEFYRLEDGLIIEHWHVLGQSSK